MFPIDYNSKVRSKLTMTNATLKIGFDLDGVLVDKPPLVSKKIVESFFKGYRKGLNYRFPESVLEQKLRQASHFYFFRPPLKKNLRLVKKLHRQKRYQLYLISSRYSFLKDQTQNWLEKRGVAGFFEKICLNLRNEQPHFFKEKILEQLGLDFYFEDDPLIHSYLGKKLKKTKVCLVRNDGDLEQILNFKRTQR